MQKVTSGAKLAGSGVLLRGNRARILALVVLAHALPADAQDQLWAYPSTASPPGNRGRCVIQFNKQGLVKALLDRGVEASRLRLEGVPSPDWSSTAVVLAHMPAGLLGIPGGRFLERRESNVILNFDNSDDSIAAVVAVSIPLSSVQPGKSTCTVRFTGASSASLFRYLGQQKNGKGSDPSRPVRGRTESVAAEAAVEQPATDQCAAYATSAVQAYQLSVSKRCRFEASNSSRWNGEYQFHYKWCSGLKSNSVEPQKETQMRAWLLQNLCTN
jgi:hypothetical protein